MLRRYVESKDLNVILSVDKLFIEQKRLSVFFTHRQQRVHLREHAGVLPPLPDVAEGHGRSHLLVINLRQTNLLRLGQCYASNF